MNIRRIFGIIVIFSGVFFAIYLFSASIRKKKDSKLNLEKSSTLPQFILKEVPGQKEFNSKDLKKSKVVVIHFSPDCEHCDYVAKDIKKNIQYFSQVELLFITEFTDSLIMNFRRENQFDNYKMVHFLKADHNFFFDTFGTSVYPDIFIYDENQKISGHYKGEVKIELILQSLGLNEK